DLKNSIITLDDATLSNSHIVIQTASQEPEENAKDTVITVAETPSMKILAGNITINNSNIDYDDRSAPRAPNGMDYAHLHLSEMNLVANEVLYSVDTIRTIITKASLKEQSGLVLNQMTAKFEMNPSGVALEDLLIKTPGSEIKRSAYISYPSLEALQANPGVLGLDIDLAGSKMTVGDLLLFVPALSEQIKGLSAGSTLYADARITGRVDNMNFQKLILRGLSGTDINVAGIIRGLPEPDNLYADLKIRKFQSNSTDILSILPKNTLPSNIALPRNLVAAGVVKGGMNNLYTDLTINSTLGGAKITGTLA